MLDKLWESSTRLLKRFGVKPTVQEQFAVFEEEVGEFSAAVQIAGSGDAVEEAIDVLVTAINVLAASGFTYEQFSAAVEKVCAKNDAKSWDTHRVNENGKIQRRGRV